MHVFVTDFPSVRLYEMVSVRDILMDVCDGVCSEYPYVCVRWFLGRIFVCLCVSCLCIISICLCEMVTAQDIRLSV